MSKAKAIDKIVRLIMLAVLIPLACVSLLLDTRHNSDRIDALERDKVKYNHYDSLHHAWLLEMQAHKQYDKYSQDTISLQDLGVDFGDGKTGIGESVN